MTDGDRGLSAALVQRDHGASAERTRLAWRRTALSASAVALLAARAAFRPTAGVAIWLITAGAMLAWVALVAIAFRRHRGLTRVPPRPGRRALPACALLTAALAVLGSLVVML